jgi:ATP-dependent DNA ligase
MNKTLYARDSKGELVEWNISVIRESSNLSRIRLRYGKLNGNLITRSIKITEGKNIGKSNETDHYTQALSEAESKLAKKINEGYVFNINSVPEFREDKHGVKKPMLAIKFNADKCNFPALVQPKLNGLRCEAKIGIEQDGLFGIKQTCILTSREGNRINLPHIEEEIKYILKGFGEYVLDGEIYCHGMKLQDINSAARKPNHNTHKLKLHIYDIKLEEPQYIRIHLLEVNFQSQIDNSKLKHLEIVDTVIVKDALEVIETASEYMLDGYEGAMVRDYNATYQFGKRTKYLQKVKNIIIKDFLLVDIIESGNDTYEGEPIAMFLCKNDNNSLTFKVTPQATKQERYEYLKYKNRYIGRYIEVTFRERTKDDKPFHANGKIK